MTDLPARHRAAAAAAWRPPFRGEIWESSKGVPMGRGYANDDQPFDIDTANYLRPVFRALRDPDAPLVVALAAVQMLKTFACIEEPAAYWLQHDPGDTTLYVGGDDSARDQAKARILPRLRAIPGVAEQLDAAEALNRHDVGQQEFYLPGMVLRIWGLNEGSTQRITLRRVLISDAFLSKASGMIFQAIARTTQHPRRKVVVESQGGAAGDDFDTLWQTTNMAQPFTVCPHCGTGQPFEFHRVRDKDFVATPPRSVPSLDAAAWVAHYSPILSGAQRRHCGFKRGDEDLVKRADGSLNESEVMRLTYYECYACGQPWHDTPATRLALDRATYYVPSHPTALPGHLGFRWTAWMGQRLRWGGAECMLGYLRAKGIEESTGNREPLRQWYQKRAAIAWNGIQAGDRIELREADYDPNAPPEHKWKVLVVDWQEQLTYGWYSVHAVATDGRTWQLARGSFGGEAELVEIQKKWGVPDQRVFMDAGHEQERLVQMAARHGHVGRSGRFECWKLFKGSGLRDFVRERHDARGNLVEKYRHPVSNPTPFLVRRGNVMVQVKLYNFSNLLISDMAQRYRDGEKSPACLFLPRQDKEPEDADPLSWPSQLNSEHKELARNKRNGLMEERWLPNKSGVPNHAWDLLKMLCAFLVGWGISRITAEELGQNEEEAK